MQTMINNILHGKLKIEQHKPTNNIFASLGPFKNVGKWYLLHPCLSCLTDV